MANTITKRWWASRIGATNKSVDVVQADDWFYYIVGWTLSNDEIEKKIASGEYKGINSLALCAADIKYRNIIDGTLPPNFVRLRPLPAQERATKCECGCEKTFGIKSNIHSDWCPKANKH